jgi:hypothetical protein
MQTAPLSKPAALLVLILSAVVALSALVGGAIMLTTDKPSWFFVGFELVVVMAGVFGVLLGRGKFSEAPAMVLLCLAGAVGVGSVLGYVGAGRNLAGVDLRMWVVGRVAAAGVFAALAGLTVLSRRPGPAWRALGIGAVFGVLTVGALALGWFGRGWLAAAGAPNVVKLVVALVLAVVVVGLLSAAVHYTVKAFATGRLDAGASSATAQTASVSSSSPTAPTSGAGV